MEVKNFEETRDTFLAWKQTQSFKIQNETNSSNTDSRTSRKILVANTQFSVTLATSWSQFRTLSQMLGCQRNHRPFSVLNILNILQGPH